MDRQIRQLKVVLFVISGMLAVSLGLNAYVILHPLRSQPSVGHYVEAEVDPYASPQPVEFAESISTEPSLLALARDTSFSHGSTTERLSLLVDWSEDNMPTKLSSWTPDDQKLFLKHLDLVLNQLLAEKEF
jgi:hypothetical protein